MADEHDQRKRDQTEKRDLPEIAPVAQAREPERLDDMKTHHRDKQQRKDF